MEKEIAQDRQIKISCKKLILTAYLYMVIPIIIFFVGWLKIFLGVFFSIILAYGLYYFIKKRYREDEYFYIELRGLLIITAAICIWVFLSGMGGYFFQRWDWHGRNAVLRDLIDYTWPVIYPETGNALVYYFVYWMIPALVGKVCGWELANLALYIWTYLGILISMLLMCKLLNLNTTKKIATMVFVYIFWGGLNILGIFYVNARGYADYGILGGGFGWPDAVTGYQYTPNNALLEWGFNQTIVPWIAIPLFLQDKRIEVLAFLGLCVLPYAPFPFIGFFILAVVWAIPEMLKKMKKGENKELLRLIFSVPNIAAIITIFTVFLFFFQCNSATNGNTGVGGIGWYIQPKDFNGKTLEILIIFYLLEFLIYAVLLYHENKNNLLYYTAVVSLFLFPFIRIGTGRDFCMRASIPSLFVIMVFVIKKLCKEWEERLSVLTTVLIAAITISSLSVFSDWGEALRQFAVTKTFPITADNLVTFCDKNPNDRSEDTTLVNFVSELPEDTFFYRYMARKKKENAVAKDLFVSTSFRKKWNMPLSGGYYVVSPKNEQRECLSTDGEKIILNDVSNTVMLSAMKGEYQIVFKMNNTALDVPSGIVDEDGNIGVWEVNNTHVQKWRLEEQDGYFMICYQEYALTYDLKDNSLKLKLKTGKDNQLWLFQQDKTVHQ